MVKISSSMQAPWILQLWRYQKLSKDEYKPKIPNYDHIQNKYS
jgi:hypothetical protein